MRQRVGLLAGKNKAALFRSGNFDDVQIGRDGDVLVITLVERPSISEINIEGNKAIKTEDLVKGLEEIGYAPLPKEVEDKVLTAIDALS